MYVLYGDLVSMRIKNILLVLIVVVFLSGCVDQNPVAETQQSPQDTGVPTTSAKDASCKPYWQCGSWVNCSATSCGSSGVEKRTCTDVNNCRKDSYTQDIIPAQTQNCTCQSRWVCDDWSECRSQFLTGAGKQHRICRDVACSCSPKQEEASCELSWPASARVVNQTKSIFNFKVTLQRIGFYTYSQYSTPQTYFRADVVVENIGDQAETLSTYDAALISGKNQYDRSYNSQLDASGLRPGVIREGYLLFENVPLDISGEIRIDVGSSYWYAKDYLSSRNVLYAFNVNLTNG